MISPSRWLRFLLIFAIYNHTVIGRHIDTSLDDNTKKTESEKFSQVEIEELITWLEDRLEESADEKELTELAKAEKESEEYREAVKEVNGQVKDLLHKAQKEYVGDSLDYMGDAPEIPVEEKKEKVMDLMAQANISWPFASNNGSNEDPAIVKEQRESNLDPDALVGSKVLRLNSIRSTILELRNGNAVINGSFPSTKALQEMFELNKDFQPHTSATSYTEKLQSFYPSCKTPNHTDDDMWSDSNLMNILFNVTYPTPSVGTNIQVMAAKLRLYKRPLTNSSAAVETKSPKVEKPNYNTGAGMQGNADSAEDERLLRVSVYWYTRALKKNRVKRKLLDSQMFAMQSDYTWVELNIRIAVRFWRESGRNHGLVVTVEDEDGAILPANRYLHSMNCSNEAASGKPLPSIVEDAAKQYMQQHPDTTNQSLLEHDSKKELSPFPDFLYPKLDICTIEVPTTDHRQISDISCLLKKIPEQIPNDFLRMRNETTAAPNVSKRRGNETSGTFFNMVGLGSPSSGQNRNALVPILTKSDVVTSPEDERMRNELMRVRTEAPRLRHSRKHASNLRNETN